mgnify:CR=1 FL=1
MPKSQSTIESKRKADGNEPALRQTFHDYPTKLGMAYPMRYVVYLCICLSHHNLIPRCLMRVIREQRNVLLTDHGT